MAIDARGYVYRTRQRREIPRMARFLTFSCFNRLPLFGNDRIKDLFVQRLGATRDGLGFRLLAYVVMPEHVHIVLVPPDEVAVRTILHSLKGPFGRLVIARWRQLRAPILERLAYRGSYAFWLAGGGYDRNEWANTELPEKIRYIHANPVRRGLVRQAADWAWSSARWYAGDRDGALPMDPIR
ncbi:MAG: transposase [Phycisphaerae bacterium]|nr:transposase [Phycisphaerae bacterium]